jgi:hypothetical protein
MDRQAGSGAANNPGESAYGASQRLKNNIVKLLFHSGAGHLTIYGHFALNSRSPEFFIIDHSYFFY